MEAGMKDNINQYKVAIYCRDTSNKELQSQQTKMRAYCMESGWGIIDEYIDTGEFYDKRPEYDRLFKDVHKRQFGVLLFWNLESFGRTNMQYTIHKLRELRLNGVEWHCFSNPEFSSIGECKTLVVGLLDYLFGIEKAKISSRTKEGLSKTKSHGIRLGRRPLPDKPFDEIVRLLLQPKRLSFGEISRKVSYKGKYGKIMHPSTATISKIWHEDVIPYLENVSQKKGSGV